MLYDKTATLIKQFLSSRTRTRWRTRFRNLAERHSNRIVKFLLDLHPDLNALEFSGQSSFEYLLCLVQRIEPTEAMPILMILLELQNTDNLCK